MDATPDLNYLLNMDRSAYEQQVQIEPARLNMLKEAACSLGARGGLARRSREIKYRYEQMSTELSTVYNFQSIMLENGLLPPVIVKAVNTTRQASDTEIQFAGVTYTMDKPARLVTVAPTWRQYLYSGLEQNDVDPPPVDFLPKNKTERELWQGEVKRCWDMGVSQANDILRYNQSELKKDFYGMLQYKILALKGEVKVPLVVTKIVESETDGKQKRLDQRTYVIKEGASF